MPRVPRWSSGQLVLGRGAWSDSLSLPKQTPETAGVSWVSRPKVPGARPGLYRSLWKFVLEEASWSGRGIEGGGLSKVVGTLLLQTLFLSPK